MLFGFVSLIKMEDLFLIDEQRSYGSIGS
jgi:hypothetical protein